MNNDREKQFRARLINTITKGPNKGKLPLYILLIEQVEKLWLNMHELILQNILFPVTLFLTDKQKINNCLSSYRI